MELNQQRIEDGIIAEVAGKMIGDDDLYRLATRAIETRVDKLWKEAAEKRINTIVENAITSGFDHEYRKIDGFGREQGEKTTIRAELERLISGYWNEMVDREGKPSSSSYTTVPRAQWLMTKMCAADFSKELQPHVLNVAGALKDHFRKELHGMVNNLLSEVFHVRSLEDQGKGREIIDPVAKPIGGA